MSVIGWQLFAADLLREWLHQALLWEMVDHGVLDLVDWMAVVRNFVFCLRQDMFLVIHFLINIIYVFFLAALCPS